MMVETKSKLNIPLAIIVVLLGLPLHYRLDGGITIFGFTIMLKYLFSGLIVVIALFYALANPEVDFLKRVLKDGFVLIVPHLVTLLFSLAIWVFSLSEFRQITRGLADTLYLFLGLLLAISYVVLFREKAVFVHLISMMLSYSILLVIEIIIPYGIGTFFTDYFNLVTTFAADTSLVIVKAEFHDLCFALGVYVVYFLLCAKTKKVKIAWAFLCLFFFSIGLKRIAVPAIVVGVLVGGLILAVSKDMKLSLVRFLTTIFILFIIAYLVLVRTGLFVTIADALGINTMGRNMLYERIEKYYSLSPFFMGYGLGYLERLLENLSTLFEGITLIHNDYLKTYIDLGFWGFFTWLIVSWKYAPNFFFKRRNTYTCMIFMGLYAYCFFTYTTDNTLYYYLLNVSTFTAVISCATFVEKEEQVVSNKNTVKTLGEQR